MNFDDLMPRRELIERNAMITLINTDNFQAEVIKKQKPILILWMHQSPEFKEQFKVIQTISKSYHKEIMVCVLEEEFIGSFSQEFNIEGTPTYLILLGGLEKGRRLGLADTDSLKDFLKRTLKTNS
jgi:thioredoxin-like negative regulator of GroEL